MKTSPSLMFCFVYSIQSDLVTPDIVTFAYLVTQSVFPSIFISAQSDIVTNSFSHLRQTMSKPCPNDSKGWKHAKFAVQVKS